MNALLMDLSINQRLRAWMWAFMALSMILLIGLMTLGFVKAWAPLLFGSLIVALIAWFYFDFILECVGTRRNQLEDYAKLSSEERAAVERLRSRLPKIFSTWSLDKDLHLVTIENDCKYVAYLSNEDDFASFPTVTLCNSTRTWEPLATVMISAVEWKSLRDTYERRVAEHHSYTLEKRILDIGRLAL